MPETYQQANQEPSAVGGCLKFGLLSMLVVGGLAAIFMVVTSLQSASPSTSVDPSAGGGVLGTISIDAYDLGFTPPTMDIAAAGAYEVTLKNVGVLPHDLTLPDGQQIIAHAGETVTAVINIPAGSTDFYCAVPGHRAAGMVGTFTAGEASSGGADDHGHDVPGMVTVVPKDPNAPAYLLRDAAVPARLSGNTHDIELVMYEKMMTIAGGYQQMVWTFGDSVPGPVIRVKVGDLVRIHLINAATNKLPHSIDFHSSLVAWNDEMTSINPGEEKLYEFRAEFAGVWMYHCGTSPALHHIANGMYGMMIVEPAGGLSKVDREFAIVQSEWYLGPQGEPASLEKAMSAAPAPDFVLFNGVANQYLDNPIKIATGERIRLFILNVGPSIDSAFHIVGTIFDRVIKEGVELRLGNPGNYGAQAVDLAPSQGAMVEFVMAEDGLYPIVTHAFNFVGRGALGLFQAGDGDPRK